MINIKIKSEQDLVDQYAENASTHLKDRQKAERIFGRQDRRWE